MASSGIVGAFCGRPITAKSCAWLFSERWTRDFSSEQVLLLLMALFGLVYLACAGLLQVWSGQAPTRGGSSLDQFNSSMLWGASITALLIAAARRYLAWQLLFWLGVTAAFAMLAIDEMFEVHEHTRASLGDDDYIKIIAWFCAGVGAFLIYRIGQTSRTATLALILAFVFQTLWLLSDLGDGDFFSIPLPLIVLQWLEEYFELLASQFYLVALILHYRNILLAQPRAGGS